MKIFIIGAKNWHGKWTEYSVQAFKEEGHEVDIFYYVDYSNLLIASVLDRLKINKHFANIHYKISLKKARCLNLINKKKYDLILILKGEELDEQTLFELKKTGIPICAWWVDSPIGDFKCTTGFKYIDYFFLFDTYYKQQLEEVGVKNIIHLPCSFSSSDFFPGISNSKFESDVAFVGSYFPPREKLILGLDSTKYNIKLWGPNWNKNLDVKIYLEKNPKIFQETFLENRYSAVLYRSSKILLNLNANQTKYNGMNQRMLEIPACMGFQLCDFREGFEEFFEDKKDIIYFRSYEEIPDLVDKYTKDSFLRKQIAENGYKKVINEHSYKNRIQKIIDTVNKG